MSRALAQASPCEFGERVLDGGVKIHTSAHRWVEMQLCVGRSTG